MEDISKAPFLTEMTRMTSNMYAHGWDERNGGNISLLLSEEELSPYLDIWHVLREIPTGFEAPKLEGKCFLVTATGSYFKNIEYEPE